MVEVLRHRRSGIARLLAGALALSAAPLLAHDFWIQPASFRPATGVTTGIELLVGVAWAGDPVARDPAAIERFVSVGPAGERPVAGIPGQSPAGLLRPSDPGLYIVAYRSLPNPVELPAPKFAEYLAVEGLEAILALRAKGGQSAAPGREIFSRCAKSLLLVGPALAGRGDRAVGLRLELVAEADPYLAHPGSTLPFRLTYEGKPLAGALVVGSPQSEPAARVEARSDDTGRVALRLDRGGVWLIKAVHMLEAPAGSGADWESLWASLTFELPAA